MHKETEEQKDKPGLEIPVGDADAQAIITRNYFSLTASERELVQAHTYILVCTVCKNKRMERDNPPCHGCNGTGKMKAIAYTSKLDSIISRFK